MNVGALIHEDRVGSWLTANIPHLLAPFAFCILSGGRSNVTLRVDDAAGNAVVLRRPPPGKVDRHAHDILRECRVLIALCDAGPPVPTVLGVCEDEAVTGAPFFVMTLADGRALPDADACDHLSPDARRTAADGLVDAMAKLHMLDPDGVGLGDLGPRNSYADRQLTRWQAQYARKAQRRTTAHPQVDEVCDALRRAVPAQRGPRIVHGDLQFRNVLIDDAGALTAVLDWEVCTLGEPLADLGYLLACWPEHPGEPLSASSPTVLPGFPSRGEVVARYAAMSGRSVDHLDFWTALGFWKVACASFVVGAPADVTEQALQAAVTISRTLVRSSP